MNALDRLRAALKPGVTIEVVDNTYRPAAVGSVYTVTKVRRGAIEVDSPEIRGWIKLPTLVRDVEWLDNTTARWTNQRVAGHTLTYRITP